MVRESHTVGNNVGYIVIAGSQDAGTEMGDSRVGG